MKYTNEEIQKMWDYAEKDIYDITELAKKNKYIIKGLYGKKKVYSTKLEKLMNTYRDKNGNII